jgi:hypothetical protein
VRCCGSLGISNFGVFVTAKESVSIGNLFMMDKLKCITETGNTSNGSTELIEKLNLKSKLHQKNFLVCLMKLNL